MADEPQDTTADPEEAGDAAAEEAAVEEPSPSGEADDETSAEGGGGTGPDVEQDEEGVAEVTGHSTQLNESEEPDRVRPGQPTGSIRANARIATLRRSSLGAREDVLDVLKGANKPHGPRHGRQSERDVQSPTPPDQPLARTTPRTTLTAQAGGCPSETTAANPASRRPGKGESPSREASL
jgi:hypothetical protein